MALSCRLARGWASGRRSSRDLQRAGYEGFLSLEPHLAESGRFSGFSGPERFHQAVGALKGMLQALSWRYS